MKNQFNNTIISALLLSCTLMLLIFSGCKKEEKPETNVTDFSPKSGPKGTLVTFTGVSFGDDPTVIKVSFNGVMSSDVQLISDTEIKAKVPAKAYTGEVVIEIAGKVFKLGEFTYELSEAIVGPFAGEPGVNDQIEGGTGTSRLGHPMNIAVDADGNLYVPEGKTAASKIIWKITPEGNATKFAGMNNEFLWPWGITVDKATGYIYVSDRNRHTISRIDPTGNKVTVIAGGEGSGSSDGDGLTQAQFNKPLGLAIDADGAIIVADANNRKLRKIVFTVDANDSLISSTVTSITGEPDVQMEAGFADGDKTTARFAYTTGIIIDENGDYIVSDANNHAIRKVTPNGDVTTIAGTGEAGHTNGPVATATFNAPWGVVFGDGGIMYVVEKFDIRKIVNGEVSHLAGPADGAGASPGQTINGPAASATFTFMPGINIAPNGVDLYVGEPLNKTVRKITQD